MGGTESKELQKPGFDESKFNFEYGPYYCSMWDRVRHVTWDTAPQSTKENMKNHVRAYFKGDNLDTTVELSVPGYCTYLRRGIIGKPDLSVSLKWAILEVLREMRPQRKFTLFNNGRLWIVSFIYDISEAAAESTDIVPAVA